ncbi:hypothetical protein EYF80_051307 [Liparis tanakae]|uniref:Uncharacterized protein n=1 Tax=Liparis tanakae TaxID=230148 RepID=A0A4Z2FB99_9TELE|nr:hypothetical protein EYF80_051307 [Liparis tanakae]
METNGEATQGDPYVNPGVLPELRRRRRGQSVIDGSSPGFVPPWLRVSTVRSWPQKHPEHRAAETRRGIYHEWAMQLPRACPRAGDRYHTKAPGHRLLRDGVRRRRLSIERSGLSELSPFDLLPGRCGIRKEPLFNKRGEGGKGVLTWPLCQSGGLYELLRTQLIHSWEDGHHAHLHSTEGVPSEPATTPEKAVASFCGPNPSRRVRTRVFSIGTSGDHTQLEARRDSTNTRL